MKFSKRGFQNLYYRIIPEPLMIRPVWLEIDPKYHVKIDSTATLHLFKDIFVNEQYVAAFDLIDSPQIIIDLGANRGLFLIYSCFILSKSNKLNNTRFLCIEPAEPNFRILMEHIRENCLADIVEPLQGAVTGNRSGSVPFYYFPKYHVTGKIAQGNKFTTKMVPVIDLAQYVQGYQKIDLLKVDIEGSEQPFFSEFQDILRKTKVLVVEFHHNYVDYQESKSILFRNGLVFYKQTYVLDDILSVEVFINPALIG
jgi:FkbM family methyltransferase